MPPLDATPPFRRLAYVADAASVHTQRWCRYFAGCGWDVHVFSLRSATLPGVTVHHLRPWWPGKSGYLTVLPRLRGMLRHLRPDLVHAHYLTSYGLLAALANRHPLIVSIWGSDIQDFPHRSPLHRRLVRWILGRADRVMATSRIMARQAEELLPSGTEVAVTPFGVDVRRFTAGDLPAGPPVIGAVGNLVPEKGFDILIRACAMVPSGQPFRLAIVGDGPERDRWAEVARSLGLADRITWHGRVPHDQLPRLYQGMTCIVVPSRRESFGVAALEAAACGRPVIAARVGGLPETVAEGISGILVPPEDATTLAEALTGLIGDPELCRTLGATARQWVCETYAWDVTAARMADLYDTILRPA